MKVSSMHKEKLEVRDSRKLFFCFIFTGLFDYNHLEKLNTTCQDFTQHIILQSNVRISLEYPIEGNIRVQVEQRSYKTFKRIDFSNYVNRFTIYTI
jgi:hypothetical protein